MANPLVVDGHIRVRFYCEDAFQQAINTVSYRVTATSPIPPTDQDAAAAFGAAAAPLYKAWMTANAQYSGLTVQIYRPTLLPKVRDVGGAGAGAVAGAQLSPQTALLVSIRTNVAAKTATGRVFLPFWAASMAQTDGIPTGAALALAANWVTGLLGTIIVTAGGNTATLVSEIWSRKLIFGFPTTSTVVRTAFATQRRRSLINKPDTLGPPF